MGKGSNTSTPMNYAMIMSTGKIFVSRVCTYKGHQCPGPATCWLKYFLGQKMPLFLANLCSYYNHSLPLLCCSYGHDFQSLATSEVLCHLWPQEHLRPSTYTGPVLPSPDTTTVNSSITQPGGMDTTSRVTGIPLQVNSANSLRQYVLSWTIISVFTLYIISMC